jgi:hypothetical protein
MNSAENFSFFPRCQDFLVRHVSLPGVRTFVPTLTNSAAFVGGYCAGFAGNVEGAAQFGVPDIDEY